MNITRYAYLDPSVPRMKKLALYGSDTIEVPRFPTPVTPVENFRRVAQRNNPLWVPNPATDFLSLLAQDVPAENVRGQYIHTDFRKKTTVDYDFTDWFNTEWTWVCSAGGAMLKPGTQLVSDVTQWERQVQWPDLREWDFKTKAARFMREDYDPDLVLHFDMGRGCTERFISLLGGYTEGMLAFGLEPEATRELLERIADFEIAFFDAVFAVYPLTMVTYHDDWGTERDTFFSEKMMEELVFAPTKRVIDHIRGKGVIFELHSCGNVTRFLPYMVELGADFLQIQRRAVNIPEMKARYGSRIGFNTGIENYPFDRAPERGELARLVQETLELYAHGGGFYASVFAATPEQQWDLLAELYAASREFYDAGRTE